MEDAIPPQFGPPGLRVNATEYKDMLEMAVRS